MTTEEWIAKNLAAAPPLTPDHIAVLRPILAPAAPHMKAAPARKTEAANARTPATQTREGVISATR